MDLLNRVEAWTKQHVPMHTSWLIATSGGPDSQVLLDTSARMQQLGFIEHICAVGIDHGLRPRVDVDTELAFAAQLAHRHGVMFDVLRVAVNPKGNVLQEARKARYAALRAYARQQHMRFIAVGHTATDQMETMLLHLVRGCGLQGAAGMVACGRVLLRPLLHISRQEVLQHLATMGITYALDPSNHNMQRARAQLRTYVTPALQRLNSQADAHMAHFATLAQADHQLLNRIAKRHFKRAANYTNPIGALTQALPVDSICCLSPSLGIRVLRMWCVQHHLLFTQRVATMLWQAVQTKQTFTCNIQHGKILLERKFLWFIANHQQKAYALSLPIAGKTAIPFSDKLLHSKLLVLKHENDGCLPKYTAESVAFDAGQLHFGLTLRSWQHGDVIRPFGMNGCIKVGDLFTNVKIPRALRATWPLLTHGANVIWVIGLRRGSDAPIGSQTRRVITIELE